MKDVSRHKSPDVLAGYVTDARAFTDHAAEDFAEAVVDWKALLGQVEVRWPNRRASY
jgi:hypothetical protein